MLGDEEVDTPAFEGREGSPNSESVRREVGAERVLDVLDEPVADGLVADWLVADGLRGGGLRSLGLVGSVFRLGVVEERGLNSLLAEPFGVGGCGAVAEGAAVR